MNTATSLRPRLGRALRPATWGLIGALLVGVTLRILGIMWGYPTQLHVDELVIYREVVDMAARRSFEPSIFYRPDHVEIKLSFIAYMIYSWVFLQQPVEVAFAANSVPFRLMSRLITVVFGLVMIVVAYFLARALKPGSEVIAAWIFALYPAYVEHSRLITPDVPLATTVMAAALAMVYYLRKPSYPPLLITSALTGVAIGIKYPGALITALIAIAVIFSAVRDRDGWRILTHGITAFFATLLATFMVSPVLFANFGQVYSAFVDEARLEDAANPFFSNLTAYSVEFFITAGLILTVLAGVGLWWAIKSRRQEAIVLVIGVVFWLALSPLGLQWERWGTPMWITPLMFAAIGFSVMWTLLRGHSTKLVRVVPVAAGVLIVGQLLGATIVHRTLPYVLPDSRVWGLEILDDQAITLDNTVSEGFSPLRPESSGRISGRFERVNGVLVPEDPDNTYALITSMHYEDAFEPDPQSERAAFYQELDATYPLVLTIEPTGINFQESPIEAVTLWRAIAAGTQIGPSSTVGPTFRVYDLRQ
jgi:hypothetical protein